MHALRFKQRRAIVVINQPIARISVRYGSLRDSKLSCGERVNLFFRDVTRIIVRILIRLIQKRVILSRELTKIIILIAVLNRSVGSGNLRDVAVGVVVERMLVLLRHFFRKE